MAGAWLLVLLALGCGGAPAGSDVAPGIDEPLGEPVHISMAALHAAGGVPRGWQLEPPRGSAPRGRAAFVRHGCHACHVVGGEAFPGGATDASVGPDLTGMGRHHPPGYFVESILSPSAIITTDGPIPGDERSTMPTYPDMTLLDLTDLAAYLSSLTVGGAHDHVVATNAARTEAGADPAPPPGPREAARFLVQRYDLVPGRLADFEAWFETRGRRRLLALDGLVSVETWVHRGEEHTLTTVFGFRDVAALRAFMTEPRARKLALEFDAFIGRHGHEVRDVPPLYRVPSLSTE